MTTLANRVAVLTTTIGTGTVTLGSAVPGFQTFAAAGITNGVVVSYLIVEDTAWEIGTGTYTATGTTMSRTPTESSIGGGAITLAGSARVFITARAADIVTPTGAQTLTNKTLTSPTVNTPTISAPVVTGNANFDSGTLFVDSANNRVGIGTVAPANPLQVSTSGAISASAGFYNTTGTSAVFFKSANNSTGTVYFGDTDNFQSGFIQYSHGPDSLIERSAGAIIFQTGGANERMRINAAGDVGIGSNAPAVKLDVTGQVRASVGVLFGNDTAAASTLDDYEEGSWTPVLSDGTNNATMAAGNGGQYIKIGRQVTCNARVITSSLGSVTGDIRITGLPFAVQNTAGAAGSCAFSGAAGLAVPAAYASLAGQALLNQSYIRLEVWDATTGVTNMQALEWSADGEAYLTLTYFTS